MSPISASVDLSKRGIRSKDFDRFDIHKNLIIILYVPINSTQYKMLAPNVLWFTY